MKEQVSGGFRSVHERREADSRGHASPWHSTRPPRMPRSPDFVFKDFRHYAAGLLWWSVLRSSRDWVGPQTPGNDECIRVTQIKASQPRNCLQAVYMKNALLSAQNDDNI